MVQDLLAVSWRQGTGIEFRPAQFTPGAQNIGFPEEMPAHRRSRRGMAQAVL
jgi:hypothetical protein